MRRIATKGRHFDREFRSGPLFVVGWLGILTGWISGVMISALCVFGVWTEGFKAVFLLLGLGWALGVLGMTWWGWNWYIQPFVGVDGRGIYIRNPRSDFELAWSEFGFAEERAVFNRSYSGPGKALAIVLVSGEAIVADSVRSAQGPFAAKGPSAQRVADEINALAAQYRSGGAGVPS